MIIHPKEGEEAKALMESFAYSYHWEVVMEARENDEVIGISAVNPQGELTAFAQRDLSDLQLTDGLARAAMNYLYRRRIPRVKLTCEAAKTAFAKLGFTAFGDETGIDIDAVFTTCKNCKK